MTCFCNTCVVCAGWEHGKRGKEAAGREQHWRAGMRGCVEGTTCGLRHYRAPWSQTPHHNYTTITAHLKSELCPTIYKESIFFCDHPSLRFGVCVPSMVSLFFKESETRKGWRTFPRPYGWQAKCKTLGPDKNRFCPSVLSRSSLYCSWLTTQHVLTTCTNTVERPRGPRMVQTSAWTPRVARGPSATTGLHTQYWRFQGEQYGEGCSTGGYNWGQKKKSQADQTHGGKRKQMMQGRENWKESEEFPVVQINAIQRMAWDWLEPIAGPCSGVWSYPVKKFWTLVTHNLLRSFKQHPCLSPMIKILIQLGWGKSSCLISIF